MDNAPADAGTLLTRTEAAKALGIGKAMLSAWTRQGCPVIFLGRKTTLAGGTRPRYDLAKVREWLANGRKQQSTEQHPQNTPTA